ncbi:amidase signature domain-containing protein, partial [Pseudoneurospora amorphoporcata]
MNPQYPIPWEARAAKKREDTLAKIPVEWRLSSADLELASKQRDLTGPFIERFLEPEVVDIVKTDSVPLVNDIRAADQNKKNNCLLEIFFDAAIKRAEELDEYLRVNGKPVGPLHGLPISLKDQCHVKGVDTTMGYVGWIGGNLGITDPTKTHQVESRITKELLACGA